MKKAILLFILLILANILFLLMPILAQQESIAYLPVSNVPSGFYISYYNEIQQPNGTTTHRPNVSFKFDDRVITTDMQDQFKKFRIYNIQNEGKNQLHEWITFQCKDNSGTIMYLHICKEFHKNDTTNIIMLDYGNTLWWFEINQAPIPPEPHWITDNIEKLGTIHDGNGQDYTDEEVYEFLSQFGPPEIILGVMQLQMLGISGVAAVICSMSHEFNKQNNE